MPARPYQQPAFTAAAGPASTCASSAAVSPQPEPGLPPSRRPDRRRRLADRRRLSYPPPVPAVPWAAAMAPRSLQPPARALPVQAEPERGLVPVASTVDDGDTSGIDYRLLTRREP